ncbi:hypothetical protein ONE63_005143 [Megalurothrips usitatus]|uniref:protein-tyrosine-phosphatase n=1 Tax=Megalurothrips usitatus TaxID=439358 RepID=A0AAV7XYF1_9NEOP|nr:hypothetical protein ONE63_005143 [Megalurothrips usitatus]
MACGARPLEWPCSGGESTDGPAAHLPALQRDSCSSRGAGGVPPPYSRCAFKSLVAGLPNEAACPALLLEFETLCALSGQHAASSPDRAARLPHNAYKNRYANIVPFDRNRVRLQGYAEDDDTANYINASFITGYSGRVEYIAAQGPKEETTRDFWCMVFEQRVSLIVMLTKLVEGDKVKCYEYYPKLADRFVWGDLALQCSVLTELPAYTLRTLVMSKGSERRVVHHLHFREWPDFGCPASATHVLHICTTVRRHAALFPGLMLVHCSAGVGRTGTLIAVDILVQAIKAKKKVDVFGVVMKLREQRQFMVQCQVITASGVSFT